MYDWGDQKQIMSLDDQIRIRLLHVDKEYQSYQIGIMPMILIVTATCIYICTSTTTNQEMMVFLTD